MTIMYHDGNRRLQDQFDSRRISDRLEEKLTRTAFTADDKAFIESAIYFFMSTADAEGRPGLLVQGRAAGLRARHGRQRDRVSGLRRQRHVQEPRQRCWSIRTSGSCSSTCTSGRAACASTAARRVSREDPLLGETVGAQLIVRVKARAIFPNCPRYIPKMQLAEPSVYVPQPGADPVEPAWKGFDLFKGYVHPRQRADVRDERHAPQPRRPRSTARCYGSARGMDQTRWAIYDVRGHAAAMAAADRRRARALGGVSTRIASVARACAGSCAAASTAPSRSSTRG